MRGVLCQPAGLPSAGAPLPAAAFTEAGRGRAQTLSHRASLLEGKLCHGARVKGCFVFARAALSPPTSLSSPLPPNPPWLAWADLGGCAGPSGSPGRGPHAGPVTPRSLPPSPLVSLNIPPYFLA